MKYEIIGLAGTVFILIGFLSNGEKTIRIFDMLGAILFVIYGVLIHAYSNIILNGILICVQIAKLRRLAKGR